MLFLKSIQKFQKYITPEELLKILNDSYLSCGKLVYISTTITAFCKNIDYRTPWYVFYESKNTEPIGIQINMPRGGNLIKGMTPNRVPQEVIEKASEEIPEVKELIARVNFNSSKATDSLIKDIYKELKEIGAKHGWK